MASPLKILQVITDTDRRGAQVFAMDLGRQLAVMGHRVETVALAPGTKHPQLELRTLGMLPRRMSTLRALRVAMNQADVTIAHGSSTLIACAIAGIGLRRPWVYRQISDSRFWAPTLRRRARVAWAMRASARVVALSSGAAETLHGYLWLPLGHATVVPNGVPDSGFRPATAAETQAARRSLGLRDDAVVALYVGALVPEKGVDLAIGAVAGAEGTHLLVVGDGPQRAELEELADRVAPERVTFIGGLDDVVPAYAAADIVMLTSRGGDSMPAVLIEAGLCGLSSITCPVGEITEVVVDGVTGIVVPIGDQPAATSALARLARDPGEAHRLGAAARKHCLQRFSIEVVADQWLDVLRAVLTNRNASEAR